MGTCSVVYTFGITEYTWVCRGRPFVFVTLDGSFFLYCDVLILIYLSMGRVLDVVCYYIRPMDVYHLINRDK